MTDIIEMRSKPELCIKGYYCISVKFPELVHYITDM